MRTKRLLSPHYSISFSSSFSCEIIFPKMFVSSFVSNPIKPASVNITDIKKIRYMLKCMFWYGIRGSKHTVPASKIKTAIPKRRSHKANFCFLKTATHINIA